MTLTQHPLSAAWPSMQDDEYQSLKDSIDVIGVQNPITLFEGMVIDGWHRYRATTELGMHCPSKLLGDVDPIDFVKSQNDARRHITASQKALAIASIYKWRPLGTNQHKGASVPGTDPQKSTSELAAIAGVSESYIEKAKIVEAKATPEVKAAVKAGTMSVKKAAETVKPKKDKPPKAEPKAEQKAEPIPEPTKAVDEPAKEDEECTELDAAHITIQELQDMLAVANLSSVSTEEQTQAANLIAELRKEIKKLQADLKNITRSRDQWQNEAAQLKKQCISQQNQIKRLKHD